MWILIVVLLIILIVTIKLELNASFIVKKFKKNNCIVWGKKRKGKDLTFQKVINKRKKEHYATNYPNDFNYGHKGTQIRMADLSVSPNTYENMIANITTKIEYKPSFEKRDTYISDAGIYLPSQYNHILNKLYPSMPIFYSVIGHLYDSNIHVNYNGEITRLWDKLREQADEYFNVLENLKIFGFIFVKIRYYERYSTAEASLAPMKRGFLNSQQKALYEQYKSQNGLIKDMWICIMQRNIHYDTRYFRRIFFKESDWSSPSLPLPSKRLNDTKTKDTQ